MSRRTQNHNNYSNQMLQPFSNLDSFIDRAFGDDFGEDFFGGFGRHQGGLLGRDRFSLADRVSNMMAEFDKYDHTSGFGGNEGTVIKRSYVSSTQFDENGQPKKKTYTSQSINQFNRDGTRLSEKQDAYQDDFKGVKKAAKQKMINDQGHKVVRTRDYRSGEDIEHNYYKGFNESNFINFR